MAEINPCIPILEAAVGRKLTDDEIDLVFTELRKRRDYLKAKDMAIDLQEAALKAADELANNLQVAAVIEKRNAAMNLVKRAEKVEWAKQTFGNRVSRSIETILVGTNFAKTGARDGVSQVQLALRKRYLAGFTNDLVQANVHDIFSSGALDRDISKAMWAFGRQDEAAVLSKLPEDAVTIGRIVDKWQDFTRVEANKEGAWIGKRTGYIIRQSHDPLKITKAGKEAWKTDAGRFFDLERMISRATEDQVGAMLDRLWVELSTGNHMKHVDEELSTAFKGPGNLARKVSESREVDFKDADAWFDYNSKYGMRNLREGVIGGLGHSAEAIGLLKTLGTNPKAQIQAIEAELTEAAKVAGDVKELTRLSKERHNLDSYLSAVDGSMNIPGNQMWARVGANIRAFETITKLGGMILSQLNDIAIYASAMKYGGRSYLGSMAEAIEGLGRGLKTPEKIELLSSLDVVLDSMVGELGRVGSLHEVGGLSRSTQIFMKLNLSQWWTERMRSSAALGLSHHMALQKGKAWGALGDEYHRVMSLYGIAEKDWGTIQSAVAKNVDGRDYLTPELVRDLEGGKELETKLRSYFVDQTSFAVIDSDAKTKALMLQGTKPGTWTGEMARFLMQFKSFTGAYMQKSMGREIYGRGYEGDSLIGALMHGNGEMTGLVRLIGVSTLMGYASLTLKDLVKNRSPRDISDPAIAWKTFLASMVQGGGAGIYGDFLFGEANRFGGGFVSTLAGPAISQVGRVVDLYHAGIRGDDVAARTFNEIINNSPFINLFYSRIALDYLFLRDIQEQLNPGYQRRQERRMGKEMGQHALVKAR